MELLTRFELVTALTPSAQAEDLNARFARDEPPVCVKKEKPPRLERSFNMELLTRFELVTSSLPRMHSTD